MSILSHLTWVSFFFAAGAFAQGHVVLDPGVSGAPINYSGQLFLDGKMHAFDIDRGLMCDPSGQAKKGCVRLDGVLYRIEADGADQITAFHFVENPKTKELVRGAGIALFPEGSAPLKEALKNPRKYAKTHPIANRAEFRCPAESTALVLIDPEIRNVKSVKKANCLLLKRR